MIKELKDLEKFFKLCRKHGVTEITVEGVTTKFGDLPPDRSVPAGESSNQEDFPTDSLSDEQLMFYAVDNPTGQI